MDNVIGLSPFFDNPSIAEDRGENNENNFSEKGLNSSDSMKNSIDLVSYNMKILS
ncbi:hypothetical protein [Streptococcus parasanguinis]|uniref:hypothetical protein n=1 Tax=Streptococcus parasanguinis TaxID=1318 RepID=UPI0013649D2A|nr:hypothetical protein [Streptococcus parasanguinis]